jgi:glycosyltransferase involved in cell wall biosynthesis
MAERLVIVQPYIPKYRRPFFSQLVTTLEKSGIDCTIAAGTPQGAQAARNDASYPDWARSVKLRYMHLGDRRLSLGAGSRTWHRADAVILGLMGAPKVGLWGHVKSYVAEPNVLDAALERWQMRRADHIFAYTESGRKYATDIVGVPKSRVTAVMNSIDTSSLLTAVRSLTEDEIERFAAMHSLGDHPVFAYIGGFDASKRIDFLAEVFDVLWEEDKSARVFVGGDGQQLGLLAPAIARGQVIYLGYVGDMEKALLGQVCNAFLVPGRIGLIAVEALLLRQKVITTAWKFHAPENEYLVEGVSRVTAPDSPREFAAIALETASSSNTRSPGDASWPFPTIEEMVDNFRSGIVRMLNS